MTRSALKRDAAAERLAKNQRVGLNAGALVSEPGAGATQPALNLVEDHQRVVRVGQFAGFGKELTVEDVDTAFSEQRFHQDRGRIVRNDGPQAPQYRYGRRSGRGADRDRSPCGTFPAQ